MKLDKNVKVPKASRATNYAAIFENARPGYSVHVTSPSKRNTILNSFNSWRRMNMSRSNDAGIPIAKMIKMSRAVDETDPRGPGFRIWFDINDEPTPIPHYGSASDIKRPELKFARDPRYPAPRTGRVEDDGDDEFGDGDEGCLRGEREGDI